MTNTKSSNSISVNPPVLSDSKERGASLVEYSLLVALIAVVAMSAVASLGTEVSNKYTNITEQLGGEQAAG